MARNFRWETVDGRRIGVQQLEQAHLENILVHLDNKLARLRVGKGKLRAERAKQRRRHLEIWVRRINRELARRASL